jgi:hypothetical protein
VAAGAADELPHATRLAAETSTKQDEIRHMVGFCMFPRGEEGRIQS